MQDWIEVTGMVIKGLPIGEYDKRITILTRERGKISAFAKGARRPNSRLMAATSPFSFGVFKLYEGKNSYNIMDVSIDNFFESLREDFEAAYYGMYFLEIADYYTRENNDDKEYSISVAIAAHDYDIFDDHASMKIFDKLEKMGVKVYTSIRLTDEKKIEGLNTLDQKMYWAN